MDFLVGLQRWISASITADLSAFAATRDWFALLGVLPFGIAFGAVHALTPGHGKIVLASYLIGSRIAVLRALAVAGALAHACRLGGRSGACRGSNPDPYARRRRARARAGGHQPRSARPNRAVVPFPRAARPHARAPRGYRGRHCGWARAVPAHLFAMFFILSRGVPEAGLTFALAMMLGVGGTLCSGAALTVLAREWVIGFTSRHGGRDFSSTITPTDTPLKTAKASSSAAW